jgi:cytochrome c peroxidase
LFRGRGLLDLPYRNEPTDERLHNTGVAYESDGSSSISARQGDFKTPTLREVARTAPCMHDGSLKGTLEDVVDFIQMAARSQIWFADPPAIHGSGARLVAARSR